MGLSALSLFTLLLTTMLFVRSYIATSTLCSLIFITIDVHVLFLMSKIFESDPELMLGSPLSSLKRQNHVLRTCKPHGEVG